MKSPIKHYRELTHYEILQLNQHGCYAEDWKNVSVSLDFEAANVRNCSFSGQNYIGSTSGTISPKNLPEQRCGLYNCAFINCVIGDGVHIRNCGVNIANYNIGDGSFICNIGTLVAQKDSLFGNGVEVTAINEAGGREVAIYDSLSAQIAYIMAMYRERKETIESLGNIISEYSASQSSSMGYIGKNTTIIGCQTIDSVNIGEFTTIQGASSLVNGTIKSSLESPTSIGCGVKMCDFIICEGATVDNGSILKRCFVGESTKIDSGFSGVDSLFFANCDMANGEACSVFAAPYTVSHHKSSLLIAGLFSFFNGGSGTNQSNHLFKMGAVHQGIHERGCKFGSNGYVALPSREGAYTVILGKHFNHHDTQNFPFSYLVECGGESLLIPAINLKSYGTLRDINKWPERDNRRGTKQDKIDFDRYNPYIGQKLIAAIEISTKLIGQEGDFVEYERVKIKKSALGRALELYTHELLATFASILEQKKIQTMQYSDNSPWVDLAGMYAPKSELEKILDGIDSKEIVSIEALNSSISNLHANYKEFCYEWAMVNAKKFFGCEIDDKQIAKIINLGTESKQILANLNDQDCKKDISGTMMVGYGIDSGQENEILADFESVRSL